MSPNICFLVLRGPQVQKSFSASPELSHAHFYWNLEPLSGKRQSIRKQAVNESWKSPSSYSARNHFYHANMVSYPIIWRQSWLWLCCAVWASSHPDLYNFYAPAICPTPTSFGLYAWLMHLGYSCIICCNISMSTNTCGCHEAASAIYSGICLMFMTYISAHPCSL